MPLLLYIISTKVIIPFDVLEKDGIYEVAEHILPPHSNPRTERGYDAHEKRSKSGDFLLGNNNMHNNYGLKFIYKIITAIYIHEQLQ